MPSRLATVSDGGSDAAGNAHAQAVAAIEVIVLWLLLAVIALLLFFGFTDAGQRIIERFAKRREAGESRGKFGGQ